MGVVLAPAFLLSSMSLATCPLFVEFFPDPVEVPDQEGEFVEIRLKPLDDQEAESFFDSLYVRFEDKNTLGFRFPQGERLVLVHDSAYCPGFPQVSCGLLEKITLPNSRSVRWSLWTTLDEEVQCRDSVELPNPKSGKSFQRVKDSDNWEVDDPTFGVQNPYYETLANQVAEVDSIRTDSLSAENSPLVITEVHHCPLEPEPEWVEVYNRSSKTLPLGLFHFCNRGTYWGGKGGSRQDLPIEPYQSIVFTKDTASLREFFGYKDVRLVQVSLGYLNNTSGSLSICYGDAVIDSVSWNKATVSCPSGFNPLTGRSENTPGFQNGGAFSSRISKKGDSDGAASDNSVPFQYRLSSRVLRQGKTPLRVLIQGEVPVELKLLDSAGGVVWRQTVPAQSNAWWIVPLERLPKVGVAYVSLSSGRFENTVGILLRP